MTTRSSRRSTSGMLFRWKAGSDVFDSLGSRVFVDVNTAGTGVGTCGERGGAKHGGLAVVGTCNIGGGKDGVLAQQWGTLLVELVSHLPFPLADFSDCRIPELTLNLRELDFLAKKVATARHSTAGA